jgi:hypothetical protein
VAERNGASTLTVREIERGRTHRDVCTTPAQEEALHDRHQRHSKPAVSGQLNPSAKLGDEQALVAAGRHVLLGETQTSIAKSLGVDHMAVHNIVHRLTRPDVMDRLDAIRADPEALKDFEARLGAPRAAVVAA